MFAYIPYISCCINHFKFPRGGNLTMGTGCSQSPFYPPDLGTHNFGMIEGRSPGTDFLNVQRDKCRIFVS